MTATMESRPARAISEGASRDRTDRTPDTIPDRLLGRLGAGLVDTARGLRLKTAAQRSGSSLAMPVMLMIEDAGFFLQGRPTGKLLYETGRIISRRPIPFMLIGATLGFLLARGSRR
jgi:hypothetical protein